MRYRVSYKNGSPKGTLKGLQEDAWQLTAKGIVDNYAIHVPRIRDEQYSLLFVMDYSTEQMTVDESSMSPELIKELNEKFAQ